MKVLFGYCLDCLVIVLFGIVRRVFMSSVCLTTVPANFTSEWEKSQLRNEPPKGENPCNRIWLDVAYDWGISRLRCYVVRVAVMIGSAIGC